MSPAHHATPAVVPAAAVGRLATMPEDDGGEEKAETGDAGAAETTRVSAGGKAQESAGSDAAVEAWASPNRQIANAEYLRGTFFSLCRNGSAQKQECNRPKTANATRILLLKFFQEHDVCSHYWPRKL